MLSKACRQHRSATWKRTWGSFKDLAADEGLSLELALKSQEMFHYMIEQGNIEHDIAGVLEVIEERSKN